MHPPQHNLGFVGRTMVRGLRRSQTPGMFRLARAIMVITCLAVAVYLGHVLVADALHNAAYRSVSRLRYRSHCPGRVDALCRL